MKHLLPFFLNPSHYLGTEFNSVHKDPKGVKLRWVLVFPDLYPVGMSYLGLQVLYFLLNSSPYIWAERCFAPHIQVGKILKKKCVPLCSLESDTPLNRFDIIGFSLTHELCYTTALYILELSKIPFFYEDREEPFPLIIAGGDAVFNPEPVSRFFDLFFIGEAEEAIFDISQKAIEAKQSKVSKYELLKELSKINGVHVPAFKTEKYRVERRIVCFLDRVPFPRKNIVPFGKPVHDRFTVEIAKGCTRGCRFCLAGMTSRPVRERSLEEIKEIIKEGIKQTGYEEISFLSLSSGDFSLIEELLTYSFNLCYKKKTSISLPSLRIDSFNDPYFLRFISGIRKTGITLAPEAGTQRLRNIINKTITHEEIVRFAELLKEMGWQNLKLYFMIGLPLEREEDLRGIFELCMDIHGIFSKKRKRTNITVSIAGFVPKPHTPFQWVEQNDFHLIKEKIHVLKSFFKTTKSIRLKWHTPEMSFVEGVFSRGDGKLNDVVVNAYRMGDLFTSWNDFFDIKVWINAFEKSGIDPFSYIKEKSFNDRLPWDYIYTGVKKEFLIKEFQRAIKGEVTYDCRYGRCIGCGVCNKDGRESLLKNQSQTSLIAPVINRQKEEKVTSLTIEKEKDPSQRFYYRIWFEKKDYGRFLSQIELQKNIERILRRAHVPVSFSSGFHPKPLISFGRALAVGIESLCEWFIVQTHSEISMDVLRDLNLNSIPGIIFYSIERLSKKKVSIPLAEVFLAFFKKEFYLNALIEFYTKNKNHMCIKRVTLKNPCCAKIFFSWEEKYINPLSLIKGVIPEIREDELLLRKIVQCIE